MTEQADRIKNELQKLPHAALVAMYRALEYTDDLRLPRVSGWPEGMPPHAASNQDLAVAMAPGLARRNFMR